jgi:polar amino acid transport system ATP-binding protein
LARQGFWITLTWRLRPKAQLVWLDLQAAGSPPFIIQGLEKPSSGHIICDVQTGFVFQDFQLFPHMTVWKNMTYAPKRHLLPLYAEKALSLLQALGLESKTKAYPHQLSGGHKQRVSLARSLILSPAFLLCDEPTSGLDAQTIDDVVTLLKIVTQRGVGMLIASHDLDFLAQMCDRILWLDRGQIVRDEVVGAKP